MDNQMINSIRKILYGRLELSCTPAEDVLCFGAEHIREGEYKISERGIPTAFNAPLPRSTVIITCSLFIPESAVDNEEYRDVLCVDLGGGEGHIYINGELYHGQDRNRSYMPLRASWRGSRVEIKLLHTGGGSVRKIALCRLDMRVFSLKYSQDICSQYLELESRSPQAENKIIDVRVSAALDEALLSLDNEAPHEIYHRQCAEADKKLRRALSEIDDGDVRGTVNMIGHTHIDVAWLWQLKDTVRKCGHTFSTMLRLMERYPEFTFTCSQLQLMDYTKTFYPELFSQIKERVKDRRWELVGSMWVESDCNITSGESLVRQLLYGSAFARDEFGVHSRVAWLPDTFSFQPNIPQILKKSDMDYFYTYKIHWQRKSDFPYQSFKWQGIDGSEIISAVAWNLEGYNGNPRPASFRFAKEHNPQQGSFDDMIFPFGYGDGGGGPNADMLESARLLNDFPGLPKGKTLRADEFFEKLEKKSSFLPKWYGELYIETHRGTMTTHGWNKKMNRYFESAAPAAEKMAVLSEYLGGKPDWRSIHDCWKHVLLMQFHDILPGSSIKSVYEIDSAENYKKALELLGDFSESVIPSSEDTTELLLFNPLSWKRDGVFTFTSRDDSLAFFGEAGEPLEFSVRGGDGISEYTCYVRGIPPVGTKLIKLAKRKAISVAPCATVKSEEGQIKVETPFYSAVIRNDGRIASLYDKEAQADVLTGDGNDLRVFMDGPQDEDAWNLYEEYKSRRVGLSPEASVSLIENSGFRAVIALEYKIEGCAIHQEIVFYKSSRVIDFATDADWTLRHRILRVYFPLNIHTQYASYETGFGTYMRPTSRCTADEREKFEVCAHRFADLSEGSRGVSLLNNCKYAHDCCENVLGLSLLRGSTSPDPDADIGHHSFTYSIYPHMGDLRSAGTPRRAHELNSPIIPIRVNDATAQKFSGKSLLECSSPDIIVDTVKLAEDKNGYIIRAYEANGNSGSASILMSFPFSKLYKTNLIERNLEEALSDGKTIRFSYKPYEIITYRVI